MSNHMSKTKSPSKLADYYRLTKPGIIRGNVMTAIAGFLFASKGRYDLTLLLWIIVGISLIIASACVFNNYIDRDIDKKMERTKNRALATGSISTVNALTYATVLGLLGFGALIKYTNLITVIIGAVGMFSYVVLYGYFKRRSVHGTLVGSISGSTSLIAGYCAVTGHFDLTALILFIIMAIWQMPHFYAIGVYKSKDYTAASLPILPVIKGIPTAKKHILFYISLYILSISLLFFNGSAGYVYLGIMLIISLLWLRIAIKGFKVKDNIKYGHQIFGFSLLVLLIFSATISINRYLP